MLNEAVLRRGRTGFVDVTVVMECSPTWLRWDEWDTHEWDDVDETSPVRDKPSIVVQAPLDATLREVLERAAIDFRLRAPLESAGSHSLNPRIGFVMPGDELGHDRDTNLSWPWHVPAVRPDGTVVLLDSHEITFRELLVSSALGLVDGDVLSPYLIPRRPQGFGPLEPEALRLAVDLVHAAYAALPAATDEARRLLEEFHSLVPELRALAPRERSVVDDMVRGWFLWDRGRAVWRWWRVRREKRRG